MGEKLSKVSLPNSAGTIITYEFKDRYAADTRITDEDLALIFNKNLSTEDELAGTWVCGDGYGVGDKSWNINFTSNNESFNRIEIDGLPDGGAGVSLYYIDTALPHRIEVANDPFGGSPIFINESYRVINITSKLAEVSNGDTLLSWLNTYWTKQNATILISFTINGTSYQAEDGMTWEQWCNSNYNTAGYSTSSTTGVYTANYHLAVCYASNSPVIGSEVIVANHAYGHIVGGAAN